jgi:adenosylhomocysteine nucleosidase
MKYGIIGAMPEEISAIIDGMREKVSCAIGGRDYWSGKWCGHEVVTVYSRCGKVSSAATASILIARFEVDRILFGVAGAVDPELNLGDVVIARELIQHDMDASALPDFERFEIPLLAKTRFAADVGSIEIAASAARFYLNEIFEADVSIAVRSSFAIERPGVRCGLIASGDRFISDAAEAASLRAALPDLLCVEMEGAAVAQICFEMETPCTVVRVISDKADHNAPVDFPRFLAQVASVMTRGIAERLLVDQGHALQG